MARKTNRFRGRNPYRRKCNCQCCSCDTQKLSQPERRRISQNRKKVRAYIQNVKSESKCKHCPENHPACLSFHHRDGEKKLFNVGDAAREGLGLSRVMEEIQKCDILCHNCHAKFHYEKDRKK